jgi:hypothetical protein
MTPSPIACRMDALTPAERARRSEVLALLTERALDIVATSDGIAFQLRGDPDTPALAGEFVAYESRCCPFIRFELTVQAEGGPGTACSRRARGSGRIPARDVPRQRDSFRNELI